MEAFWDFFKWVFGVILVILTPILGMLHKKQGELQNQYHSLDRRLSLVEEQKKVDPIKYTEAVSAMASSIQHMAATHKEFKEEIHKELKGSSEERQEMRDMLIELLAKQRNQSTKDDH